MVDVRIKPLEWELHPAGGEQALAAGLGLYRVHENGDDWYLVPDHMGTGGKAAAQADYERRIRSTLSDAVAEREAEPVAAERFSELLGPLIDGQVIVAALENGNHSGQPAWLWRNHMTGVCGFRRWSKELGQSPYIRADIVLTALVSAPPTSELEALRKRVADLEGERDLAVQDLITIDGHDDKWAKLWRATDRAEAAEARVKAMDEALGMAERAMTKDSFCEAERLEEGLRIIRRARAVKEGG